MSERNTEYGGVEGLHEDVTELKVKVAVIDHQVGDHSKKLEGIFSVVVWAVVGAVGLVATALLNWVIGGGLSQ